MKESYREGVANHPGPEPCEGSRKAALEALDRGICRLGIELRKSQFMGSRRRQTVRKATTSRTTTRVRRGPAESKTPRMQRNSVRENREIPLPPAGSRRRAGGRTR
jgi:hypothetical protein